jgi:Domain of unknown function (DUF1772)
LVDFLQVAGVLLVALTMVPSLAHALELPGKLRLARDEYLAVQPIYYPGFTYVGAAEPLAVIAVAILLKFTPTGTAAYWLTVAALVSAVLTHLIYWVVTAPVNRVWLKDTQLSSGARRLFDLRETGPGKDWTVLRDRWERSHLYRAVTAMAAFLLLLSAVAIQ